MEAANWIKATVKSDRFVFHNGVQLHGPVTVTPEVARQAGLPAGMTAGYYAAIVEGGTGRSRPDSLKWQDAANTLVQKKSGMFSPCANNLRVSFAYHSLTSGMAKFKSRVFAFAAPPLESSQPLAPAITRRS